MKLLVFIFALFMFMPGFAQQEDTRVLITLGDEDITVSEFLSVYKKNNIDTDLADKKSMTEYLELYVNFRLKVKEARDLGMDTVQSFIDELAGYRAQLAEPYFNDQHVSDELLQEAYDRLLYDIRASHILIKVDVNALPADTLAVYNRIMDVRSKLMAGEDFGTLAAEYSDDPSARDREAQGQAPARKGNGGDLGYFTVFDMVYPFETGAYTTEVGEVSMPVRTDFGYHLIKVTDRRDALGKATVAHLYLAEPKNPTPQDLARREQEINDLYQRIMNGENFEELVKNYSDDRGSKDKGGVLPRFGSNRMVPEFIVAVSEIEDSAGYSKPVHTSFGWHILKLIERTPPGDYKVEVLELKRRMTKDSRANKSKESVINRIKKENNYKEFPENLQELYLAIDSSFYVGEWSADKVASMNKKLVQLGKTKYSQHDFGVFLEANQRKRGTTGLEAFVHNEFKEYVVGLCIDLEDSQLEDKYPEFRLLMGEYRDGILLFNLTEDKVWNKATLDTLGLEEFYLENQDKYMWGERLEADIIILNDPAMESDIRHEITRAAARNKSLKEIGLDTLDNVIIKSGVYAKGDNSFIDKIVWTQGHSTAAVLTDYNDLYDGRSNNENSIIFAYVYEIRKPEPKTLDEARGIVTSQYQTYLEKEWVKELKAKYPVTIHEEIIEDIN